MSKGSVLGGQKSKYSKSKDLIATSKLLERKGFSGPRHLARGANEGQI